MTFTQSPQVSGVQTGLTVDRNKGRQDSQPITLNRRKSQSRTDHSLPTLISGWRAPELEGVPLAWLVTCVLASRESSVVS